MVMVSIRQLGFIYLLLTSLGPPLFSVEGAGALGWVAYVVNMFWEVLDPSLEGWGPRGFHAFGDGFRS